MVALLTSTSGCWVAALSIAVLWASGAHATPTSSVDDATVTDDDDQRQSAGVRTSNDQLAFSFGPPRDCAWPCYWHTFVHVGAGRGLRFNNPYRLQTQLGSQPESLSATAPYLDARVGAVSGDSEGLHHGVSLGLSWALQGVPQQVLTPSYQLAYRVNQRHWLRASLGPAIVLQPDPNVGVEVGADWVLLIRAGIGVYLGLTQATYWGAATDQRSATLIPLLSAHAGISLHYEVLP